MSTGTDLVTVSPDSASYPMVQRSTSRVAANSAPGEYLSMRLGNEEYAIEILKVQEIRSYEAPTHIANSAPCVQGVLNLRGNIVPVIDLHQLFSLPALVAGASTVTIVLNLGNHTVGVVADAVNDVVELREQDIKATPGFSGAIKASHITGIGTLRTAEDRLRMLILIDVQELLSSAGVLSEALLEAA